MVRNRSGEPWTVQEAIQLYDLIFSGVKVDAAQKIMGRTEKAFIYKTIQGGLCHKDLSFVLPHPTKAKFIINLRKQKSLPFEIIPPHQQAGKLSKLFTKISKNSKGLHSMPINKQALVPFISKKDCMIKHKKETAWYKFSCDSQSNAFMRSQTYKKAKGLCAYCNRPLSEGEYQAHHSSYDHTCTFDKTIFYTNTKNKKVRIPDCETCFKYHPDKFKSCLSLLHAVHGMCNKELHELEK